MLDISFIYICCVRRGPIAIVIIVDVSVVIACVGKYLF